MEKGLCPRVSCISLLCLSDEFCARSSISESPPRRQSFFDVLNHDDCQPRCKVVYSECVDGKCLCKSGYLPTYLPAPILSSRPPTLVFCQSLTEVAVVLNSNAAMANNATSGFDVISDQNGTAGVVPVLYFPGNIYFSKKYKLLSVLFSPIFFFRNRIQRTKSVDAGYDWHRLRVYRLCWRLNLPDVVSVDHRVALAACSVDFRAALFFQA